MQACTSISFTLASWRSNELGCGQRRHWRYTATGRAPLFYEHVMHQDYQKRSEAALERALYHTRAYAPWKRLDPGNGAPLDERFAALPRTDKAFIRAAFPHGLIPDGMDLSAGVARGDVEFVETSGTTDECVTNLWNQRWWDFSERASWALNAQAARVCTGNHREAILTSARNVGPLSDGAPLRFEARRLGRFLYLNERSSPLQWDDAMIRRMADELDRFAPAVLEANPSYLAALARRIERLDLSVRQPELVVFTYEYPSAVHVRAIRRVFAAPQVSSYGATECGYVLVECESGHYHLNATACRADFIPWAEGDGEVGHLLITPFNNEWLTLLRFDPSDLFRVRHEACPCGRTGGFVAQSIEGRVKSLCWTPEGRPVFPRDLDQALAQETTLVAYQLVQQGPAQFHLCVELEAAGRTGAEDRLVDLVRSRCGVSARIEIEVVAAITPEPSGKYLLVKAASGFIPGKAGGAV